ncbi:WecB/TagA/CpsF family glycosyltransferase [Gaoshiqia sediminis]|uniref:WecB/TagA/CpsF family glycosyltransferase n=1 Tax=Gaoshiqia sediminis TaxID=2986998 RepID=A0AA41Y913_9BACT|nr:WecB/TagA/CpsF family glycosyltransferase [Gaoshiqia sediminis]MCW0483178.1 WecB/TagA/CpsF family glycosyltransferase [Gaoshiqia sediminis]
MNTVKTIGFTVYSDDLALIPIRDNVCRVINTISPNSYGVSTRDKEFERALKTSDYLVLDGVYFAFSSLLLQGKNIKRNQGPDVFYHFIARLNQQNGKAFFLGSSEGTLQKIRERARKDYPNLTIETYSPPFKLEFSEEDNQQMVESINAFQPDILFVGMTCPKQEKWAIKHRELLRANLVICIGNVFDWFAGTQKPIHPIWFKLRIGWLVRIFLRPEVFKRNIGNQMLFFWHVILIFLKIKKYDTRSYNWTR